LTFNKNCLRKKKQPPRKKPQAHKTGTRFGKKKPKWFLKKVKGKKRHPSPNWERTKGYLENKNKRGWGPFSLENRKAVLKNQGPPWDNQGRKQTKHTNDRKLGPKKKGISPHLGSGEPPVKGKVKILPRKRILVLKRPDIGVSKTEKPNHLQSQPPQGTLKFNPSFKATGVSEVNRTNYKPKTPTKRPQKKNWTVSQKKAGPMGPKNPTKVKTDPHLSWAKKNFFCPPSKKGNPGFFQFYGKLLAPRWGKNSP